MRSNGSRLKTKSSKDAQAERIVRSLTTRARSGLASSSKKISKRRRNHNDQPPYSSGPLHYSLGGRTKRVIFSVAGKGKSVRNHNGSRKSRKSNSSKPKTQPNKENKQKKKNEVSYANLLLDVYEVIKSESSQNRQSECAVPTPKASTNHNPKRSGIDGFAGIEYDPSDNQFYLFSHTNQARLALFSNKAMEPKACVGGKLLNIRRLEMVKRNFALDSFLS